MDMNNKIERIRSIVNYLKMLDMIDDNVRVDEKAIAINANIFNKLLYDIYKCRDYKTAKELAKYVNKKYKIRLNEDDIQRMWDNNYFMDYMSMMYNKHTKLVKELNDIQSGEHEACHMVGGEDNENKQPLDMIKYDDHIVGNILSSLEDKSFVEREDVKSVINELPIFKAYAEGNWDEVGKLLSDYIISLHLEDYMEMIFFPLYYLEKGETFGKYNSIIIDLFGLWLNGVAIFLGFITPIMLKGLNLVLMSLSVIPMVGAVTAPMAAILGIVEGPLISLVNAMPMFFKFLMSIQRKDFKRALDYLSRIFPMLGVVMISATNIITLVNKFLLLYSEGVDFVDFNIGRLRDFFSTDGSDVYNSYKRVIQPNMSSSPLVKGIVKFTGFDNTMNNFNSKRKKIMDKYNEEEMKQMGGIMRDLINKQNELKEKI
jgi:hypothetical protein